jgi:uncharacterized protein (UPF0332 family)
MTLEGLMNIGDLESHTCNADEISELLLKAEGKLSDSKLPGITKGSSLSHAYSVILTCATIALNVMNYRVKSRTEHHYITLVTLLHTLHLSKEKVDYYQSLRELRHQDFYSTPLTIAQEDVDEAIAEAEGILHLTRKWLKENYPEYLK